MLDNPPTDAPSSAAVKRYAPPNQRNKLNRRKSGDRLDRASSLYGNDGDKNQAVLSNENARARLVPLTGCANSEVSQFINDRWQSTMQKLQSTTDPSEKPVLFSSAGPAWGQIKLPHQMVSGPPGIDFLAELKRSMQNSGLDSN
uniref:Uncharacterized protein n=1 Tax=Kalanchoe fedtschenkoi TaxID=63787 RepID=A0A7N0ZZA2_KALFE